MELVNIISLSFKSLFLKSIRLFTSDENGDIEIQTNRMPDESHDQKKVLKKY